MGRSVLSCQLLFAISTRQTTFFFLGLFLSASLIKRHCSNTLSQLSRVMSVPGPSLDELDDVESCEPAELFATSHSNGFTSWPVAYGDLLPYSGSSRTRGGEKDSSGSTLPARKVTSISREFDEVCVRKSEEFVSGLDMAESTRVKGANKTRTCAFTCLGCQRK